MEGFAGKIAVVTGAGSGIGRALAIELARSGAKLAISDVDTEGLAVTEERLNAIGAPVKSDRLDVTEREAFQVYADAVNDHYGKVNQIYNNAGIAFIGDIEATEFKDLERVMDVDYWGVVNGTKVFLPHLIASGDGHVVNISSVFGLLAVPGQGAYNAAKFAVRGFTEALRQEMIIAGHPVKVTCVHPGGIKTAIVRNAAVGGGPRHGQDGNVLRQAAGYHVPAEGRTDHSRRCAQEQGPRAGRQRRQGPRHPRPRDGIGLSTARCRSQIASDAGLAARRAQRVFGQESVGDVAGIAARRPPVGASRTSPAVSSTPATSLSASTCISDSSLRRYSGTTFSARISAVRSASTTTSTGMSGSAVDVHTAFTWPARSAPKSVAAS